MKKIKLLFSPDTKNGRAMRTFLQGSGQRYGSIHSASGSPESGKLLIAAWTA